MVYSKFSDKGIAGIRGLLVVLGGIPVYYVMLWYKRWRAAGDSAEIPSQ